MTAPPTAPDARDARRVTVRQLSDGGMSNRAIAARLRIGEATVRRDLAHTDAPPAPEPQPAVTHDDAPDAARRDARQHARDACDALRAITPDDARHTRAELCAAISLAVGLLATDAPTDALDASRLRHLAGRIIANADGGTAPWT